MKGKRYSLSIRVDEELGQKIDGLASKYFNGNRTALVTKAIEEIINRYDGNVSEQSPSSIHAKVEAKYIRDIILQSSKVDMSIIKKEVDQLCQLLD